MIVPRRPAEVASVALHYDELDEFYQDVWGEHVHHGLWQTGNEPPDQAVEQLVHLVAERAGIAAGSQVCDVGCGYGGTSRILASRYGADVTGLTVSASQHRYASVQTVPNGSTQFLLRPWEQNELPTESFDAVVSIECVSHVADKPEFYRQIHRVLRPGGKAVVIAWLANSQASRFGTRHLLEPICREGRLPGMATSEEHTAMIADADLRLLSFEEISRSVRKTWWICARRLVWKLVTRLKYLRAVLHRDKKNRVFALTLFRILAAYHSGAMQYGVFQMVKGDDRQ